jgi:hypothetical protein
MGAFAFLSDWARRKIMITAHAQAKSTAERIFENIIFLEDVFGNRDDDEMPDVPVLELAKSFELKSRAG